MKPGGYFEASVLDIDMVNMGNRTKRTVDQIKSSLREQPANKSDWTKKAPSDKALHIMAKKGFVHITRCWVGLPAVGNVDGSREERASMQQVLKEVTAPEEIDMTSAEGMNRAVPRVGRWWYSKCFEDYPDEEEEVQQPRFKSSLWEDKTLLRECEKKRTNFRMLITFARKPLDYVD